jgi:hypothetical protein
LQAWGSSGGNIMEKETEATGVYERFWTGFQR